MLTPQNNIYIRSIRSGEYDYPIGEEDMGLVRVEES